MNFLPHVARRGSSQIVAARAALRSATTAAAAAASGKLVCEAAIEYTRERKFFGAHAERVIPTYQVLDLQGRAHDAASAARAAPSDVGTLLKMYTTMVQLFNADQVLYDLQRQGAISFYMTSYGEYATHVGSAAALTNDDVIFGQYREAGVLMYRGFTVQDICNQCFSNEHDLGKGRQMPVHYGSRALNFQTISSPLSTQIPQAAGAAYALKSANKHAIVVCYFGEGAASEGDFHAALNFAATLECPVVFFCRNNRYAISTPVRDQFRGDGIAARGPGYGVETIRVDGNDALAVYDAMREAKRVALTESRPVLIEAMTYRIGHHSTSDDSTRYRAKGEIDDWNTKNNPITRFRAYLESRGLWDKARDDKLNADSRQEVLVAMRAAETAKKPPVEDLFRDVYDQLPPHLLRQQQQLLAHLEKHGEHYALEQYQQDALYKKLD
jgi:2-oxoisovalerate dehydrogenase E1 component alpha subunit